jgi:hypothetical protein
MRAHKTYEYTHDTKALRIGSNSLFAFRWLALAAHAYQA